MLYAYLIYTLVQKLVLEPVFLIFLDIIGYGGPQVSRHKI